MLVDFEYGGFKFDVPKAAIIPQLIVGYPGDRV